MSLERRLSHWVEAGLIDEAAMARILAYEQRDRRPVLLWALAGLGLLAVWLGMLLLIAANWDRIADWLKLGVHLLLLAAAGLVAWWARGQERPWLAEGALFLFAGLAVGGIALQAQVYQLTGPTWHLLLLWLAIAGPALWLGGATRLTGLLLAALALAGPALMAIDHWDRGGFWLLAQGAAMAVPVLLLLLSLLAGPDRPGFRLALRQVGVFAILLGASLVHLAWADALPPRLALENLVRLSPPLLAVAATLWLARNGVGGLPRPLWVALLVAPLLAVALAIAIPHPDRILSRILGIAVYGGLWALVARGAVQAGQNGLFAVAVAAIAVRIFLIYVELFGSLAATGGGLVGGGLLLLGLGWGWQRLVAHRRRMPAG